MQASTQITQYAVWFCIRLRVKSEKSEKSESEKSEKNRGEKYLLGVWWNIAHGNNNLAHYSRWVGEGMVGKRFGDSARNIFPMAMMHDAVPTQEVGNSVKASPSTNA